MYLNISIHTSYFWCHFQTAPIVDLRCVYRCKDWDNGGLLSAYPYVFVTIQIFTVY